MMSLFLIAALVLARDQTFLKLGEVISLKGSARQEVICGEEEPVPVGNKFSGHIEWDDLEGDCSKVKFTIDATGTQLLRDVEAKEFDKVMQDLNVVFAKAFNLNKELNALIPGCFFMDDSTFQCTISADPVINDSVHFSFYEAVRFDTKYFDKSCKDSTTHLVIKSNAGSTPLVIPCPPLKKDKEEDDLSPPYTENLQFGGNYHQDKIDSMCPTTTERQCPAGAKEKKYPIQHTSTSCFQCYQRGRNAGRFFRSSLSDNFFTRNHVQAKVLKTVFRILSASHDGTTEASGTGFKALNKGLPYLHIKMCLDPTCGKVSEDTVKDMLTKLIEKNKIIDSKSIKDKKKRYVVGRFE